VRVGYIRVSTIEQNTVRQLDGIDVERTFTDKASGKDTARPSLDELVAFVRDGRHRDRALDGLARPQPRRPAPARQEADRQGRPGGIHQGRPDFHRRGLTHATLRLSVMGAFAEFERALILERQGEGIAAAKQRGVYTGRKPALNAEQAQQLRERAAAGERKSVLARDFGISRETVYSYLRPAPTAETA
jgi:DNA invertase Pin-like site-specific DNA recombinase